MLKTDPQVHHTNGYSDILLILTLNDIDRALAREDLDLLTHIFFYSL